MKIYTLDPLLDGRWDSLVETHRRASAFHRRGWLEALARTYGYRPIVLTSTPPGQQLSDGIVFCEVNSWITGSRLVSLPFADHAEPLLKSQGEPFEFNDWLGTEFCQRNWKYIELRPVSTEMHSDSPLTASQSYWLHSLDLTPSLDQIFLRLNKNCIQRRIRRAENEHLEYEQGSSEKLLNQFYRLLLITRRRHQILPQPRAWFRNLITCMRPNVEIRVVRKGSTPIAAMLTLTHRSTVVYKYGCSDEKFHFLGGMPFLFWQLIQESKAAGAELLDFGRTDLENSGLLKFKDRLGTTRKKISYFRYPERTRERLGTAPELSTARRLFAVLPDALASSAGWVLYRHIG